MNDWLHRANRDHPVLVDLAVVAFGLLGSWASVYYVTEEAGWLWAHVLGTVPALTLFWRRRAPFAVFGICGTAALTQWLLQVPVNGSQVSLMLALYTIARFEPVRSGRIALAVCLALVAIAPFRQPFQGVGNTVLQALFVVVVWVLGTNIALRQGYLRALEERAQRLEQERDTAVRAATLTERTRIAREMHDVVAHHVSVMVVQAEGAGWAIDTAPEQAKKAVETIADTGRSTLTELRILLGVLRDGDAVLQGDSASPQPGLADLPELIERFRFSGLEIRFAGLPDVREVPESVQLAVYRVVQEGLTNVLKHAGVGTRVKVTLEVSAGETRVAIEDDGSGEVTTAVMGQGASTGHGLIGIRERAALFGGGTEIGPLPGQGFRVRVRFPA